MNLRPDHRVTLHRRKEDGATFHEGKDISADIISISMNKGYGKCAGGFSLVTNFRRAINSLRYDQIVKPNDIIHIELDRGDGSGIQSRMLCLVSRAARKVTVNNDQSVTRRVNITGMDFGKILAVHECASDITPGIGLAGIASPVRQMQGLIFSGTAHEICASVFDKLFLKQLPWCQPYVVFDAPQYLLPATGSVDDWITYDHTILESKGSVWAAMKQAANEPYNVLTTETRAGRFHVTLEKYPFEAKSGKLTRQTFHRIDNRDIVMEDLGIDDSDTVNYVWLKANAVTIYNTGGSVPLQYTDLVCYDSSLIQRFGFRTFYPETNFVPPRIVPNEQALNWREACSARAIEFWNRHNRSHTHESGTLSVKGDPRIKAGDALIIPETDMEYFIEGWADEYVFGEKYTTSLTLTRGQAHA